MSIIHAYSNQVADGTATSVVRPSDWNSAHVQQVTLSGNVVGQSSFSARNVVMQGGPNVTLSGIVAGALATLMVSAASPAAAYSLANSNGIIFGTSNGQVTASYSVPATYPQTQQPMAYAAGGVTKTANTLPFSNANGVSFVAYGNSIAGSVRTDYASSDITTNALALSHSSLLQPVSNTSAITSAAMPISGSTVFQQTSNSSLFQLTSGMAAYQRTSNNSLFQYTSATSQITSNALHSTLASRFQYTSATSAITSLAMPLANSTALQFTSNTSAITSAAIHTSLSSLFTGGGGDFSNSSLLALSDHDHGGFQLNLTNLSGSLTTESNGLTVNISGPSPSSATPLLWIGANNVNGYETGSISFSDSHNVIWGINGSSVMTASAHQRVFSNSNGVTFGTRTDGVVTASVATASVVTASVAISCDNGSLNTDGITFWNGNGINFFTYMSGVAAVNAAKINFDVASASVDNLFINKPPGFTFAGGIPMHWPIAWSTFESYSNASLITYIGAYVSAGAAIGSVNNYPNSLYADGLDKLNIYGTYGINVSNEWYISEPKRLSIYIDGNSLIKTDFNLALTNISATKSAGTGADYGKMTLSLSAGAGAQYSLSGANGIYFTSYTSNSQVSISDIAAVYQISVAGTNVGPVANNLYIDVSGALQASVPSVNGASVSLGVPYPTLSLSNISGSVSTGANGQYTIRLTGVSAGGTGGGGGIYVLEHTNSTDYAQVDAFLLSNPGVRLWDTALAWNEVYADYGEVGTNNEVLFYAPFGEPKVIALHTENASTYRNLSETIFSNRPIMLPLDAEEFRRMNPNVNYPPLNDKNIRLFVSGAASSNRSLGGTIRAGLYTAGLDTNGDLAWNRFASASEVFNFTASSQSSAWNGPMLVQLTGLGNTAAVGGYVNPRALIMFSPVSANATWFNLPIYGAPQVASGVKLYKDGTTAAIGTSQSIAAYEGMYSTTTAGLPSVFYTSDFVATASQYILRPWFEYFDPSGLNQ